MRDGPFRRDLIEAAEMDHSGNALIVFVVGLNNTAIQGHNIDRNWVGTTGIERDHRLSSERRNYGGIGAGDEARTRNFQLGKLTLYH